MSDQQSEAGLPRQRVLAVVALTLATATVSFDSSIPNVALPTIARQLDVPGASAVSIVSAYQIVLMMTLLPFAALAQRFGRRRILRLGVALFVAGGSLCLVAPSLPLLIALRACQGLGAAAVISVGPAMVRSLYPPRWLGRGLAINTATSTAAMAAAPTVGGLLLSTLPWYWLFAIGIPAALASLLLSPLLPESERHDTPFDITGALYCMSSFGLVFAGIQRIAQHSDVQVTALLIALGVPVSVLFVRRELRVAVPILPLDLLQRRMIALTAIAAVLIFVASTSLLVTLPFRLHDEFGFSPATTGAILATWALTMMLCAPTAGMLSDRLPAPLLGSCGMALSTLGAILLALIPADASEFDISWRVAVCSAGYAFYVSPSFRMVVNLAPMARVAAAASLMSTARMGGQALGATAASAMLALGLGHGAGSALISALLFAATGVLALMCRAAAAAE